MRRVIPKLASDIGEHQEATPEYGDKCRLAAPPERQQTGDNDRNHQKPGWPTPFGNTLGGELHTHILQETRPVIQRIRRVSTPQHARNGQGGTVNPTRPRPVPPQRGQDRRHEVDSVEMDQSPTEHDRRGQIWAARQAGSKGERATQHHERVHARNVRADQHIRRYERYGNNHSGSETVARGGPCDARHHDQSGRGSQAGRKAGETEAVADDAEQSCQDQHVSRRHPHHGPIRVHARIEKAAVSRKGVGGADETGLVRPRRRKLKMQQRMHAKNGKASQTNQSNKRRANRYSQCPVAP